MRYAVSNGVKIHYHVEGDGPPIILQREFALTEVRRIR